LPKGTQDIFLSAKIFTKSAAKIFSGNSATTMFVSIGYTCLIKLFLSSILPIALELF